MRKILIVGDSLGMVRPDEGLSIEDVYPFLLQRSKRNEFFVINASQRANTSSRINSQDYLYEHVDPVKPDVVILQIGIVDCTPRIFTELQKKLLSGIALVPWLRPAVSWLIKRRALCRYDLTKQRTIVHVTSDKFKINLISFFEKIKRVSPDASFIIINILHPGFAMTSRNHGMIENVIRYNQKLAEVGAIYSSEIVDLFSYTKASPEVVLADGHHIGKIAHQFIVSELLQAMRSECT